VFHVEHFVSALVYVQLYIGKKRKWFLFVGVTGPGDLRTRPLQKTARSGAPPGHPKPNLLFAKVWATRPKASASSPPLQKTYTKNVKVGQPPADKIAPLQP
jgi:hypothetical protein